MTQGSVLLFAALTLVNVSSFLFHVAVSRELGPPAYGALGALLGLLLVVAVPTGALQVVITNEVACRRGSGAPGPVPLAVRPLLAQAAVWGAGAGLVLLLAAPVLRSFLHLPSLASAALLAAYVLPAAIGVVPKAVLLGRLMFARLATGMLAGAAARLLLGWLLVRAGAGVEGAMAATVLGEVLTAAILLPALASAGSSGDRLPPLQVRWRDAGASIVAFSGFWLLTGVDTLLARHYLPARESGLYAAAATAGRAAMFLPVAVALVALPRFAPAGGTGAPGRRALLQALAVVGVLGAGAAAVLLVAPRLVVGVLFGTGYHGSTTVIGVLGISSACLGVTSVLVHFHIATRRHVAASLCWGGVGFMALASLLAHGSLAVLASLMLVATVLVALSMLYAAVAVPDRRGPRPGPGSSPAPPLVVVSAGEGAAPHGRDAPARRTSHRHASPDGNALARTPPGRRAPAPW